MQRLSEPVDVVEANVPFAAFHLSHVAPVKLGSVGQLFLTDTQFPAQFPDAHTERFALSQLLRKLFRFAFSKLFRGRGWHSSTVVARRS